MDEARLQIEVYTWVGLEKRQNCCIPLHTSIPGPRWSSFTLQNPDGTSNSPTEDEKWFESARIDAVLPSHCPGVLLLRTIKVYRFHPHFNFVAVVLAGTSDDAADEKAGEMMPDAEYDLGGSTAVLIAAEVRKKIKFPLGILPDGRLVFINPALWVCSVQLRIPVSRRRLSAWTQFCGGVNEEQEEMDTTVIKRHFFIPHDWVTVKDLRLCRVLEDGTVLCPTKGEVAVIRSDLVVNNSWITR